MVVLAPPFILLAILVSTAAAPVKNRPDALIDLEMLSDDPSKASLLDTEINGAAYHPALSPFLFHKRSHYAVSGNTEDDNNILDMTLFGSEPYHHDDDSHGYLLDVDLRRRVDPTTGDIVSPEIDDPPKLVSDLESAQPEAADRRSKRSLLDIDIGGPDHYTYISTLAPTPSSAPTPTSAPSAPTFAPTPAVAGVGTGAGAAGSGADLVFDPNSIAMGAVAPAGAGVNAGVKTKTTKTTKTSSSKPTDKLPSKPNAQASLTVTRPTPTAALAAVASVAPAPATTASAAASTVTNTVYYAHDQGNLLDLDILKRNNKENYVAAEWERRPTVQESQTSVLLSVEDEERAPSWVHSPILDVVV